MSEYLNNNREKNVILFPECLKVIPETEWSQMRNQGLETGFAFIDPLLPAREMHPPIHQGNQDQGIDLGTGILGIEQLKTLLNHLPVDITLVDEKDEVRYFSSPGKRIFPRLPAIIGRKVKKTKKLLFIH